MTIVLVCVLSSELFILMCVQTAWKYITLCLLILQHISNQVNENKNFSTQVLDSFLIFVHKILKSLGANIMLCFILGGFYTVTEMLI